MKIWALGDKIGASMSASSYLEVHCSLTNLEIRNSMKQQNSGAMSLNLRANIYRTESKPLPAPTFFKSQLSP